MQHNKTIFQLPLAAIRGFWWLNQIDIMLESQIERLGYKNVTVYPLGDGEYRVIIKDQVHVQEIKDNFNMSKWGFDKGVYEFYITYKA